MKHSTEASTNWGRRKNCTDSIRKEKKYIIENKSSYYGKNQNSYFFVEKYK
jgi:hypothetical protein